MRKYIQLLLVIVCIISVFSLLVYRHEYYRLRYVLEVLNFFGKPGLSEVEFCGPGFNATLLSELMQNSSLPSLESPPVFQQIDDNFYAYSSFIRHNPRYTGLKDQFIYETDTIAVGKKNFKPKFGCHFWMEDGDKPKVGKFKWRPLKFMDNADDFELYIFHCGLLRDIGVPIGLSFYANNVDSVPIYNSIHKLVSVNTNKHKRENSAIKFVNNLELTACIVPNKIPLVSKSSIIEFLAYHEMMGITEFNIYDSSISFDVTKRINLLPDELTKWKVRFYPLNYPFSFSKAYNIVRNVVELDCVYRHLQIDKELYSRTSHVVLLSWNEFLVPRYHHHLKNLLNDVDPMRKVRRSDLSSLTFCTNQRNDPKVKPDYPEIVKKTHYYKDIDLDAAKTSVSIINLDAINSFEEILSLKSTDYDRRLVVSNKTLTNDIIAVHKYIDCSDNVLSSGNQIEGGNSKFDMKPHVFEGAMLKFAEALHSNKIYRLYKTGKIWDKPISRVRDML